MKAKIFNIQKFCNHDGPGIRTTVFFSGCPLRCVWCHNPEGQTQTHRILFHRERCIGCGECLETGCGAQIFEPVREIDRKKCIGCGKCVLLCPSEALEPSVYEKDVSEILESVMQDKAFYGREGGITISGGEPMNQPEAALELLELSVKEGITTAVETCGFFPETYLKRLVPLTGVFLWDFKDSNPERHLNNTGVPLDKILKNLKLADSMGANIRLRCILIRGVNTEPEHAKAILELADSLDNLSGIDLIKYHPMGKSKYEQLGEENSFDDASHIPTEVDVALFRNILAKWL